MRENCGGGFRPPPKPRQDDGIDKGHTSGDEGGGRRTPPSMHGGGLSGRGAVSGVLNLSSGAGIQPASGDYRVPSGGLDGEVKILDGPYFMEASSACAKNIPVWAGSTSSGRELHGASLGMGTDDMQIASNIVDGNISVLHDSSRALISAQTINDNTCMVSHDEQAAVIDACKVSNVQVNIGDDACMFLCNIQANEVDATACGIPPFPSPSASFNIGSFVAKDAGRNEPLAQQYRSPGVCVNASPNSEQPAKVFRGAHNSANPWDNKNPTWKRSAVIPLIPSAELGHFSLDESTVILDEDEVDVTINKFHFAIVGRMFGRRIPYALLSSELSRKWGVFGGFRLITLSCDCFVCVFDSLEACDAVLVGGPWIILGQVLGVNRWSSTFSPSSLDGFNTPVWIRMPGLPLYCWGSKNISRIAALVGEPICMDAATDQINKGIFARACVNIDLSKPLKPGVWVQGRHGNFFQRLEYEGLSIFCYRCCQVGHKISACKVQPDSLGRTKSSTHSPQNIDANVGLKSSCQSSKVMSSSALDGLDSHHSASDANLNVEQTTVDYEAGPWMIVHRKRRPSNGNQRYHKMQHDVHSVFDSQNRRITNRMKGSRHVEAIHPGALPSSWRSSEGASALVPGGLIFNSKALTKGNTQSAADGGMPIKSINKSLPPNSSRKDLVGNFFMPSKHNSAVWIAKNQPMENLQVQNNVSSVELLKNDMPCATKQDASLQVEAQCAGEHNSSMHGLDETMSSHGALVPYNSHDAIEKMAWEGGKRKGVNSLKVERMLNDLGPVSLSPRKRRMIVVMPDGGDASPLPTS